MGTEVEPPKEPELPKEPEPPKQPDPPKEPEPPKENDPNPIKEVVREVLQEMGIRPNGGGVPTRRGVDIEAMAEEMVAKASEKLRKEEALTADIEQLKQKVAEVVEETPTKLRRSTKLLWGDKK